MEHGYEHDVCVVGAGRVGLPWAVLLATNGFDVVCVDVDEDTVAAVSRGELPFEEPRIEDDIGRAHEAGRIEATTDPAAVSTAPVVGFCLYCTRDGIDAYLSILADYADYLSADQVVVNRSTLPLDVVGEAKRRIADRIGTDVGDLRYVVFPERTGAGEVARDMDNHPAIVGTEHADARDVVEEIVSTTRPRHYHLGEREAMFVKLIDNSYRDAVFALANYYVVLADQLGLSIDGSRLVEIAEDGYKNQIYDPGPVGGKCLRKDSYFLSGEWTPDEFDLFGTVRGIHGEYEDLVERRILEAAPDRVAVLGTSFKKDVGVERASPGLQLRDRLEAAGIEVAPFDPHVPRGDSIEAAVDGADVTVLAMNHTYFADRADEIMATNEGTILDLWGVLDGPAVERV